MSTGPASNHASTGSSGGSEGVVGDAAVDVRPTPEAPGDPAPDPRLTRRARRRPTILASSLAPLLTMWEWQQHGACVGRGTAEFFNDEEGSRAESLTRNRRAKAICDVCPVIERCRTHALETPEPYGVWGGLSAYERMQLVGRSSPS